MDDTAGGITRRVIGFAARTVAELVFAFCSGSIRAAPGGALRGAAAGVGAGARVGFAAKESGAGAGLAWGAAVGAKAAEPLVSDALEVFRTAWNANDPRLLNTVDVLSFIMLKQEKFATAVPLLRELVDARRAAFRNQDDTNRTSDVLDYMHVSSYPFIQKFNELRMWRDEIMEARWIPSNGMTPRHREIIKTIAAIRLAIQSLVHVTESAVRSNGAESAWSELSNIDTICTIDLFFLGWSLHRSPASLELPQDARRLALNLKAVVDSLSETRTPMSMSLLAEFTGRIRFACEIPGYTSEAIDILNFMHPLARVGLIAEAMNLDKAAELVLRTALSLFQPCVTEQADGKLAFDGWDVTLTWTISDLQKALEHIEAKRAAAATQADEAMASLLADLELEAADNAARAESKRRRRGKAKAKAKAKGGDGGGTAASSRPSTPSLPSSSASSSFASPCSSPCALPNEPRTDSPVSSSTVESTPERWPPDNERATLPEDDAIDGGMAEVYSTPSTSPEPSADATEPEATGPNDSGASLTPTSCIVCMDAPTTHVFVPCGHFCVCGDCSDKIMARTKECPYCRQPAMMAMKTFAMTM